MKVITTIDTRAIKAATQKALAKTAVALKAVMDKETPVNTGYLLSTGYLIYNPGSVGFAWSAPYAVAAHDGHTTDAGVHIDGTPWTVLALAQFNVSAYFKNVW
jgi:hypothetical protein